MSVPSHPAGVALGRFERERPADRASARSISLPAWAPSLLIAFLLTVPAWGPVVLPSFNLWTLFDGSSHMSKAFALGQLIEQGNWYPRWVPSFYGGYGYPTFNYYGPLTYYLTLLVKLLWPAGGLYVAFQLVCAFSALSILGALYFLCWRRHRHGSPARRPRCFSPCPRGCRRYDRTSTSGRLTTAPCTSTAVSFWRSSFVTAIGFRAGCRRNTAATAIPH